MFWTISTGVPPEPSSQSSGLRQKSSTSANTAANLMSGRSVSSVCISACDDDDDVVMMMMMMVV